MIAELHIVATYRLAVPEAGIEAGWDVVYVGRSDQAARYNSNVWPKEEVSVGMVRVRWTLLTGCKLVDHDDVNGTLDGIVWSDYGEPLGALRELLLHVITNAVENLV